MSWCLLLSLGALLLTCQAQLGSLPQSPCPEVYGYERDDFGEVRGLIAVLTPKKYADVRTTVVLSSPVSVGQHEVGELVVKGGTKGAEAATQQVLLGRRHVLQYHLKFPPGKPVPSLVKITVNGRELCASNVPSDSRAQITLQSFLSTGVTAESTDDFGTVTGIFSSNTPSPPEDYHEYTDNPFFVSTSKPTAATTAQIADLQAIINQLLTATTPRTPPSTTLPPPPTATSTKNPATTSRAPVFGEEPAEDFEPDLKNCGIPETAANQLVVFGTDAIRGEWPWQTAIYKNEFAGSQIRVTFQCGGTLVTRRHIISAAHCVVQKKGTKLRKVATSSLVISLGKNKIHSLIEEGQQTFEVEEIMVHPNYNEQYNNDLSVILLATTVKLTPYVKPVCLWDRTSDLSLVVGKVGAVAGWGRDETGSITDKLKVAKMPVVSQETCLRSDNFYTQYTSENTLCAGFRNGTTVCNGDSGGGLHFHLDNSVQNRRTWYLRGVVSVSMLDTGEQRCDIRNYVVFTDVAKYMIWVKQQLRRSS